MNSTNSGLCQCTCTKALIQGSSASFELCSGVSSTTEICKDDFFPLSTVEKILDFYDDVRYILQCEHALNPNICV